MPKFNLEVAFATLIPDFIYQFLSSAQVNRESLTCLELEDVGESINAAHDKEFDGMKQFLALEHEHEDKHAVDDDAGLSATEKIELMSERLDAELEEVDNEMYHRYTPGELKYIFGEIIDNIERVYGLYKENTGLNLALSVSFVFRNGIESSLVIEFLHVNDTPEPLSNVYLVPMKNYMVSDDILARVYFLYEEGKKAEYEAVLEDIAGMLQLKPEGYGHEQPGEDGHIHKHGPDCGHVH